MSRVKEIFNDIFKSKDDYLLDTYEDQDKKIKTKAYKKIGFYFVLVPIVGFILMVIIKALPAIYALKTQQADIKNEEKIQNTKLKVNNDEIWKLKSEEKQKELDSSILSLKDEIKQVNTNLNTSVNEIKNIVIENNEKTSQELTQFKQQVEEKIESKDRQFETFQETNKVDINKLKDELKNETINVSTKLDPNKLINLNDTQSYPNETPTITKRKNNSDYEYVEIGESTENTINTLQVEKEAKEEKKKEFTLVTGFAKGTLINGGNLKTMSEGTKETLPIVISLDTKLKTPNNEEMDLRECFVRGAGKADFTSATAEITITNIQCHLVDSEGNHYKINKDVEGWVFDEVGGYGVKGRLITKEGEIIAKALPLAFLQTGLSIMTENARTSRNTTSNAGVIEFSTAPAQVGANAGRTIIDKMGDLWLKYIDGLNPKVNLRPGREVVVGFKGGEVLTLEKFIPADIGTFNKEFEDNFEGGDE